MPSLFLALHLFFCFSLTGLIWTIQVVHYPSFRFATEQFKDLHAFHTQAISWIVIPLMLGELTTAFLISEKYAPKTWILLNILFILLTWASTFLLSVPRHNLLATGFDIKNIQLLVSTNWPRTLFWSLRSVAWIFLLIKIFRKLE